MSMPPPSFQPQSNFQGNFHQPRPFHPNYHHKPFYKSYKHGQIQDDFDGKRLRKSVMRKTVDYNSSIIKALEVWCSHIATPAGSRRDHIFIFLHNRCLISESSLAAGSAWPKRSSTRELLRFWDDATIQLHGKSQQRDHHTLRKNCDEQNAMPNLHVGLDSRRSSADHRGQLRWIHAVEWTDIQLWNNFTSKSGIDRCSLVPFPHRWFNFRLTQSRFVLWSGLTTTAGWLRAITTASSSTGRRTWIRPSNFKRTRSLLEE